MPQPLTMMTIGSLTIAGALLGAHLGNGAIKEVDPHYFSPLPASRFFADLVPGGYSPSAEISATDANQLWVNNLNVNGRPECFGCGNFVDRSLEADTAALPEPLDNPESETVYSYPVQSSDVMPPEVQRYANFPVTREEAERPTRQQFAAQQPTTESQEVEEPELLNM